MSTITGSGSSTLSKVENHYNGLNDILLGVGLTPGKDYYNNNYKIFNKAYYEFLKASPNNKSNLPKPGKVRQVLKKYLSPLKASGSSKLLRSAGYIGIGLTILNIYEDYNQDGAIKVSSAIDIGLVAGGAILTAVFGKRVGAVYGAGVLIYGILDYTYDIGDKIDAKTEQIPINF